jgi:hypothetical protein
MNWTVGLERDVASSETFEAVENEQLHSFETDAMGCPRVGNLGIRVFVANGEVKILR